MTSQNMFAPYAVHVTDGMVKYRRRGDFFQTRDESCPVGWDLIEIEVARNEHEPFQVVIQASEKELKRGDARCLKNYGVSRTIYLCSAIRCLVS